MTTTMLHVAEDLELPADVVTQRIAIVGRTGSGKTTVGVVLAEEMIRAGLPLVILDPLGVWYGLRSSPDGEAPGLPVVIFGGDHGDLPLPVGSGTLLADVVVDQRPAAVIDLSGFDSDAEIRRWSAAFLKQLYRRNRSALHVVVDEADMLAPQQGAGDAAHSLSAMKSVARRGRVKGLGLTLITQRPASLAKEVLNQAELLVAMQTTGPRDIAAIDDWMSDVGDQTTVRDVRATLPTLVTGEAWWWSPAWLRLLRRVQVRRRDTFDSSATPKPGETRLEPTRLAEVDLAALGEQIAALQAEADTEAGKDPKRLRARVRDLERQLAERPAAEPERVEVPVLTDEHLMAARGVVDDLRSLVDTFTAALGQVDPGSRSAPTPPRRSADPTIPRPRRDPRPGGAGPVHLKAGARKMLDVLGRQHPVRVSRAQLGTLSGLAHTGGTFSSYLSALRTSGLVVEREGLLELTEAGKEATDASAAPVSRDELLEQYRAVLKAGARSMLDVVVAAHPESVTREFLADITGITASGGTFGSYLSTLRRNGLVTTTGDTVVLGEVLADAPTEETRP